MKKQRHISSIKNGQRVRMVMTCGSMRWEGEGTVTRTRRDGPFTVVWTDQNGERVRSNFDYTGRNKMLLGGRILEVLS